MHRPTATKKPGARRPCTARQQQKTGSPPTVHRPTAAKIRGLPTVHRPAATKIRALPTVHRPTATKNREPADRAPPDSSKKPGARRPCTARQQQKIREPADRAPPDSNKKSGARRPRIGRMLLPEGYLPTTASSSSAVIGIFRSPRMRLPSSVTRMSSSMRMPPKSR